MPESGLLKIALQHVGDSIVLTFADNGFGIESKDLPLVFQPFFTTKGLLAGGNKVNPGLGLSVVHGTINEMGGTIEVKSIPGKSTCFTITFPLAPKTPDTL